MFGSFIFLCSTHFTVADVIFIELKSESCAEIVDLFLACQEDKNASRGQSLMDFLYLFEGSFTVVRLSDLAVVSCHGILPCRHFDAVRRFRDARWEESLIGLEVLDAESSTHDDQTKGEVFELRFLAFELQLFRPCFSLFVCKLTTRMGDSGE